MSDRSLRDASAEPKLSDPDGLREALEKLANKYADELGTVSYQWLSETTLKPLLAAHPAGSGAPVADRDRVAETLADIWAKQEGRNYAALKEQGWPFPEEFVKRHLGLLHNNAYRVVDALFAAGVLRSEAEVSVYYCPTAGEVEQYPGGGFDVCCDAPEKHVSVDDPNFVSRIKAEALREAADLGYYNSAWLRERADELEEKR